MVVVDLGGTSTSSCLEVSSSIFSYVEAGRRMRSFVCRWGGSESGRGRYGVLHGGVSVVSEIVKFRDCRF